MNDRSGPNWASIGLAQEALVGVRHSSTLLCAGHRGVVRDFTHIRRPGQIVRRPGGSPWPRPNVVDLLKAHGVVVLRPPLDTGDVDAFSLPFSDRPVVVLGDKNDRARSRFDGATNSPTWYCTTSGSGD